MNRPTAVVWDMGGVLYRYFTELLVEKGSDEAWPLEELPLGPTGPARDPAYDDLLEGRIDEADYARGLIEALAGHGISIDPTTDLDWTGAARPRTWDAIARIGAAGYPQVVLTNDASRWLGHRWWETWEPARHFDGIIDAITLPERKPAPGPYIAAATRLGVAPEDCILIDDHPVNCRGAEAVGMTSLTFDIADPDRSIDRLVEQLGIA